MNPQIKATLALPFVIAAVIGIIAFLVIHPMIIVWVTGTISVIMLLGVIWYSLYVLFGGVDDEIA